MEIPVVGIAISSLIAFLIVAYLTQYIATRYGPFATA